MTNKNYSAAFWIIALFLLIFLPFISQDFGITFDEWAMSNGGILALRFLFSAGKDTETLTYIAGPHPQFFNCLTGILYGLSTGSLFEFVREGLQVEKHILPFFKLSHQVNAVFGFLAIFFAGRIAKEIAGVRAGVITLLLMAFSPRFIGDMMNNSKDIPFAGAYAAAIFYMLRFLKQIPAPDIKTIILLTAAISAAIGVRVGGYLLFCYAGLFTLIFLFWPGGPKRDSQALIRTGASLAAVLVLAYFGGMIFWPYAQVAPFKNPFVVLKTMSHFIEWNEIVLFEGRQILADSLPWYYLPKSILITVPPACIGGWMLFMAAFFQLRKNWELKSITLIIFAAIFPLVYIIAKHSIVYDGWRHVLFIYAPLCVLAALGWEFLLNLVKAGMAHKIAGVFFLLVTASTLPWMLRNHPNEYVYFNPLFGGLKKALGHYETDYFGNCIRESSEWLMDYHEKNNPYQPLIVRADGHVMSSYPYLSNKFHEWYLPLGYPRDFVKTDPYRFIAHGPYLLGPLTWDYAILLSRGWEKAALQEAWPPPGTIHTVKADDTVLCAVVKNSQSLLK